MVDDMSFDTGDFRKALGSFTTGVTVVTTKGADGDVGLTANSFNSVSLDPPMILWSLGKSANSLSAFKSADYFAVHILSADQEDLSNRFARRGIDKFSDVHVERGPKEIPLLADCAARFICRTAYQYEGGDHLIFVGEVLGFDCWDRAPLLFHGGKYGKITKETDIRVRATGDHVDEYTLGHLLRLCGHQIFLPLKSELSRRDMSLVQYFFLALVGKHGRTPLDELLGLLKLAEGVPQQKEIDDLIDRSLIDDIDGRISLTPEGTKLHVELASFYKGYESQVLKDLDFDMRQALSIGLLEIIDKTKGQLDE